MIKYLPQSVSVVLEEIPDKVSLAVDITRCRGNCTGCHSPFLRTDIGEELTPEIVKALIADNFGVNCFLFLGEGDDVETLVSLSGAVREAGLAAAVYSGRNEVEDAVWQAFDFVKLGPYIPERGPLDSPSTNQRLYAAVRPGDDPSREETSVHAGRLFRDITSRFWRRGLEGRSQ